jgi:hypothetical protein
VPQTFGASVSFIMRRCERVRWNERMGKAIPTSYLCAMVPTTRPRDLGHLRAATRRQHAGRQVCCGVEQLHPVSMCA